MYTLITTTISIYIKYIKTYEFSNFYKLITIFFKYYSSNIVNLEIYCIFSLDRIIQNEK